MHRVHIPNDHNTAIEDNTTWPADTYRVYTDRSDIDGGIGVAAVLYPPGSSMPKVLTLYLYPSTCHTMYKVEIVTTILGLELLWAELHCREDASIALDNMAAIQASTLQTPGPAHYFTDIFHTQLQTFKTK